MAFAPGTRLGRYALVAPLGRGGMGEVWEAVLHGPQGFQKRVALKILAPAADDALGREVMAREARLGALLSHPNVVATHDLGESDGRVWIAMELVRGVTAGDLIRQGHTSGRAVLELGLQATAALAHVHALHVDGAPVNLVHRDVKPSNLLVDQTGLVKLADLGIARIGRSTGDGWGTPAYMPLEQVRGAADHRSDLFALGVTLHALATRKRLLRKGHEVAELLALDAFLESAAFAEPVEARVPGLSHVLRRALRADPEARYPSAAAFAEALAALRVLQEPGATLRELVAQVRPELHDPSHPHDVSAPSASTLVAKGNLPRPRDRFLGRDAEVAALSAAVRSGARVVTVLGPGGAGKTRLSIEVGRLLGRERAGGAWFVDLSEARTVEGVCGAVGRALSVPIERGDDPVVRVGQALRGREEALFVLDNFEQCVEAAAGTLGRWLPLAPEATFLVTSRIALRLSGEERFPLGPLSTADGVALFTARAARPVHPDDADDVERLVAELEGLPLAIELAAARTRFVNVAGIRERLADRLRLLTGGSADRPERQRSLRASLDGSWELLAPWGRAALAQLSVFEGGFTLEAAEAVLDLRAWPEAPWAMDVLEALADASLVRFDGVGRFRLLVAVQAYAAEKLEPAARVAAEGRHAAFFAQLGTGAALDALHLRGGAARLERLVQEADNLVAAHGRALASGDRATLLPLTRAAIHVFRLKGPYAEAHRLLDLTAPFLGGRGPDDVPLRAAAAAIHRERGDAERSIAELEALLADTETHGSPRDVQRVLFELGLSLQQRGRRPEAARVYERGMEVAHQLGDGLAEAQFLANLGTLAFETGDVDTAAARFEAALPRQRAGAGERLIGGTLANVGVLKLARGQADAEPTLREAIELLERAGDRRAACVTMSNLGSWLVDHGDPLGGEALLLECLDGFRTLGARALESTLLGQLGSLYVRVGRLVEAERRFREALASAREVKNPRTECAAVSNLGYAVFLQGRSAEGKAVTLEARAIAEALGDRRYLTLCSETLAQIAVADGDLAAAEGWVARAAEACPPGNPECAGLVALGTALVREAQGRTAEARVSGERAVDLLGRSNQHEAGRAHLLLARVAQAEGAADRAAASLAAARASAEPYGPASPLAAELRAFEVGP
jgi:predicted ATPase